MLPHRFRSVVMLLALAAITSYAENIIFPADAGILDVTKAPYSADSTGVADATAAICLALKAFPNSGVIVYLPNGTYKVSDTLRWPGIAPFGGPDYKNVIMQGQSRDRTILKLPNSCPGYSNPSAPKPMIWTGPRPPERFRISIRNLTVNTGSGNPGAVGMQYNANNQGTVQDVAIVSGDGTGVIGLDMGFTPEIGPLLIKNVSVSGFDMGIRTYCQMNSMTMEHISLSGQKRYGLYNRGQVVSIRDLKSSNAVTAIYNAGDTSFLTILDSKFTGSGGASSLPAILNQGTVFARSCTSSVYSLTIRNTGGAKLDAPGPIVTEFTSHPVLSLFPSPQTTLNLPIKETPDAPWDTLANWVNVRAYVSRAVPGYPDTNWTPAIQAAIDAGKSTVYFPRGSYGMLTGVTVRGAVRRIIGCEATVQPIAANITAFTVVDAAGSPPVVWFERMSGGYYSAWNVLNSSSRTVVMKNLCNWNAKATGSGDFFIEDVCSNPWTHWEFGGQSVWARQFNAENEDTHILNNGAKLWVLGLKTERGGTLIETKGGGYTELLGGLCHSTTACRGIPLIVNTESSVSITLAELHNDSALMVDESGKITWCDHQWCWSLPCTTIVQETRDGQTKTFSRTDLPAHLVESSKLPLYVGYKALGTGERVGGTTRGASVSYRVVLDSRQSSRFRLPPGAAPMRIYDAQGRAVRSFSTPGRGASPRYGIFVVERVIK